MNYVPNASEITLLDKLRLTLLQGGSLRGFKSNYTPVAGDVAATYTAIESTFGGYASIVCSSWGAVATNATGQAETVEVIRTWVASGAGLPETIYGIFFVDVNGLLAYADKFGTGGITLSAAGQTISYLPVFTLVSA